MKTLQRIGLSLMVLAFLSTPVPAQRRRQNTPRVPPTAAPVQPTPTLENFLAADSYKIYVEIRGVGQLLRSPSFSDVIDPIMKVAGPPKEFKTLMKWLNSESDALMSSRMVVASWPSRPKLPKVLFAIEFASPEDAQKFEPRLRTFLPKFLPTPMPESSPRRVDATNAQPNAAKPVDKDALENRDSKPKETLPPYIVKRSGELVYISDTAFNSMDLRPTDSKLLMEDATFRRVHDRFSTESVLVYVDSGAIDREEQERRQQMEDEQKKIREAEAANPPKAEPDDAEEEMTEEPSSPPPPVSEATDPDVVPQLQTAQTAVKIDGDAPPPESVPNLGMEALAMIGRLVFGGGTIWPEAIGVAVAFEADAYAVRLLLVNEPGVRGNPVPFIPQLISGPSLTPESPSVFPSDTEFFVALSLDYPQIYEGMVKALSSEAMKPEIHALSRGTDPASPFAAYEKQSGIKIKDEIIPLLGNEIAISLPMKTLDVGPAKPPSESTSDIPEQLDSRKQPAAAEGPNPVIAISVKDREGVRILIPKLIESFGFKGAGLLAQTEKRGDTEITSYANALSYAFIGNFLLVSPDSKALRHVVDSYLNHDTLASESHFRNYTRWQPRQVQGQFYVSPALMDSYSAFAKTLDASITEQLRDLFSKLSPTSEPITYALSNEGTGPLHELRLPKNLAMLMIAGLFGGSNQPPTAATNEAMAKGTLRTIVSAEATYQATEGNGSYGTIDQLVAHGMIAKDVLEKNGYRIEVTVSGERFEARAMPLEYGKSGKLSFFVDESGVLRGGDKGGGPATVADNPM